MLKRFKTSIFLLDIIVIFSLVALSFFLRFSNIKAGVYAANYPNFHYFSDEIGHIQTALRIGEGQFSVGYVTPLFFYVLFLFDAFFFLLLKVSGPISSLADFKELFFLNTDKFLFASRLFISFLGSITVGLVYLVGKKVFTKTIGVISGIFLLFSFGHFVKSTEVRPDILFSLFYLLSIYFLYLIFKNPEKYLPLTLGGLTVALAASIKPNGLSLLVPFVALFTFLMFQKRHKKSHILKGMGLFLTTVVITFCICNFAGFLSGDIGASSGAITSTFGSLCYQAPYKHSLLFYLYSILPRMISWPITVVFFIATITIPIIRKKNWHLALLILIAIYSYLLPMGWYTRASWRDVLPIIPLIYLIFSYFIVTLVPKKNTMILSAAIILFLIIPIKSIYSHINLLHQQDTRDLSKSWIETNIPSGSRISIQNYGTPLKRNKDSLLRQWKKTDDKLIASLKYFDENEISYDIYLFSKFIDQKTKETDHDFEKNLIGYLKEREINYLILSSRAYSRWFAAAAEIHKEKELAESVKQYYQTIEDKLELIKEFVPDKKNRPGPVIKIYRARIDIENYNSGRNFKPYLKDGAGTVGYYWH